MSLIPLGHGQFTDHLRLIILIIKNDCHTVCTWRPESHINDTTSLTHTRTKLSIISIELILQLPAHSCCEAIIAIFEGIARIFLVEIPEDSHLVAGKVQDKVRHCNCLTILICYRQFLQDAILIRTFQCCKGCF